jgi:hypothetical protein
MLPGLVHSSALLLLFTVSVSAKSLTLYVSTNGNDGWSGRREQPAHDGADGPLASLPAALKVARAARVDSGRAPDRISILLRGGTYPVAEPIILNPADSGSDDRHPFLIAALGRERPVLSGGRRIGGWKRVETRPGLWQAEIPEVRQGHWYLRQLFIDGKRKKRARSPNTGYFQAAGEYLSDNPARFKFHAGDLRKEWIGSGVEVVALHKWIDLRQFIRELDETNQLGRTIASLLTTTSTSTHAPALRQTL